ncbi:helix-turn-helix domain-containing protein [Halomarina oriensis]|uniref:Transcriptional regulator n=1 Tax=Halomarina oriensis TaxID=671145 RepID=A0A6B0GLH9_9EURY|nr:helix-turn-helix domain-containing protein [Halomarina oriensis]MWG34567.1 transcriptional regulator [Halomarina oriensis]
MYEATVRIADAGGLAALTADGEARIELWCNDHCDLLSVTGGDDALAARLDERFGVRESLARAGSLVVVTERCLRRDDPAHVDRYLERHDCLLVPPLRYVGGAKLCRLLALDAADLSACFRALLDDGHRVTVEQKRSVGTVTPGSPLGVDELLPDLTARQREAFVTAYEQGYYEIPRATTTDAIADVLGVERRTAEEHLRRAENKLAAALVSYLR